MRPTSPLVLLLLVAGLSGCLEDDDVTPPIDTGPTSPYDLANGFTVGFNSTGCQEGIVLVLVEPATAQRALPAGFTAADAGDLLGTPATGKAAVGLNALRCAAYELADGEALLQGEAFTYVEPPSVGGVEPIATNFYVVGSVTSSVGLLDVLRVVGWSAFEGTIESNVAPQAGGGATGSGRVDDESSNLYQIGYTAPSAATDAVHARFWHAPPGGLAYVEYEASGTVASGTGSCSLRSGSFAHNATGVTNCAPGSALSIVIPFMDWTASIRWMPGATAA